MGPRWRLYAELRPLVGSRRKRELVIVVLFFGLVGSLVSTIRLAASLRQSFMRITSSVSRNQLALKPTDGQTDEKRWGKIFFRSSPTGPKLDLHT